MTPFLSIYIVLSVIFLIVLNVFLRRRRIKKAQRRQAAESGYDGRHDQPSISPAALEDVEETKQSEVPSPLPEKRFNEEKKLTVKETLDAEKEDKPKPRHDVNDGEIKTLPIISVLILGAFVSLLNQTLMNVALPKIMTDLNITTSTAQWITTGYMLVNGVLIPITAFLMETFSTRKLFITAVGLFSLGTLVCALSPGFTMLMVGRVIQAAGAGIIMPLMTNVFLTIFPPEKRGAAMGLMGVAMIFAPAIGPTLSGYVVEHYSWRLLFWIVLPFGILDILLALSLLRNVGRRSFPKLDLLGVILSTIGFGGILYAFSEAGNNGWGSASVMTTLIVGVIALVLFVWRELTTETPLLEIRVFKYSIFTFTTIINILVTMAMFAAMILLPVYLQNIRGFTPLQSGLLLLPGAILMGIMSPITGILFDRMGSRPLAIIGLIITVVTTWDFGHLTDATTYGHIMMIYSARMFGMSLLMMPIMTEGLNDLPRRLNSHGTAMSNTMRQVAGSLGTAFLVTVMTNRTTFHVGDYANHLTTSNSAFTGHLGSAASALEASEHLQTGAGQSYVTEALITKVEQMATIQGINDSFIVATGLTIVALLLSFFIKRATPSRRKRKKAKEQSTEVQNTEPATE